MTPQEAWDRIVSKDATVEDSPLDYADEDQKSKSVVVEGYRWAVVLRRIPL